MKSTTIYLDMDGTVFNLYGKSNWLELLRTETAGAFAGDNRMFDEDFYEAVAALQAEGVQFGVITWLPMQASPEYAEICRTEKLEWCKQYLPFLTSFVAQPYGVPKQDAIEKHATTEILIDDNEEICKTWATGEARIAFSASQNTVTEILYQILETHA